SKSLAVTTAAWSYPRSKTSSIGSTRIDANPLARQKRPAVIRINDLVDPGMKGWHLRTLRESPPESTRGARMLSSRVGRNSRRDGAECEFRLAARLPLETSPAVSFMSELRRCPLERRLAPKSLVFSK